MARDDKKARRQDEGSGTKRDDAAGGPRQGENRAGSEQEERMRSGFPREQEISPTDPSRDPGTTGAQNTPEMVGQSSAMGTMRRRGEPAPEGNYEGKEADHAPDPADMERTHRENDPELGRPQRGPEPGGRPSREPNPPPEMGATHSKPPAGADAGGATAPGGHGAATGAETREAAKTDDLGAGGRHVAERETVTVRRASGQWHVVGGKREESHKDKQQAIQSGRQMAKDKGYLLVVEDENGNIEDRRDYGRMGAGDQGESGQQKTQDEAQQAMQRGPRGE